VSLKNIKRKALSISAAAAAIGLLAGCGSPSAPSAPAAESGPVTIDVWGWDTGTTPNVVAASVLPGG
jgi:ABC-type glycerol-3-phosphate transport system substrate-binding protein